LKIVSNASKGNGQKVNYFRSLEAENSISLRKFNYQLFVKTASLRLPAVCRCFQYMISTEEIIPEKCGNSEKKVGMAISRSKNESFLTMVMNESESQ